jgi:thiamine biosynthesis protein ThiS
MGKDRLGRTADASLTNMPLTLTLNGTPRTFDDFASPVTLAAVIAALGLKADRVAVEHNGLIAPRSEWHDTDVHCDDRLEVVQFVGGGSNAR